MKFIKKKPNHNAGFSTGDEAIVTGDTASTGHEFEVGEKVVLGDYDNTDDTWKCNGEHDYWWVNAKDLDLVVKPPTDKELKDALKSIKQSANNLKKQR